LASEAPVERLRDLAVAALELVECAGGGGGALEVVGVEQLAFACPRWSEPLSTIQKARRAEA
jgi:hypothetical protein